MKAFLTKCSCKTGLNESGIYNCDVHKQRNASLSQLSINMGLPCSQQTTQREKSYETLPLKAPLGRNNNLQFKRLGSNYLTQRGEQQALKLSELNQQKSFIGGLREDLEETIQSSEDKIGKRKTIRHVKLSREDL